MIVPWLRTRGEQPRVVVGTSAGAINALLVAALAHHEDPHEAVQRSLALWRQAARTGVFRPLMLTAPGLGLRYLARLAGIGDVPVSSVLDPAPLRKTLAGVTSWPSLHRNVASGLIE